jgi:predicted nucleotidyltransferase
LGRLGCVERLDEIAHQLAGIEGVVGVCLGGSRARGTHRPDSDYDLGIYYHSPPDTAALRTLAAELAGKPVDVTEPGGWGPWVDGGGWLTVDGVAVDWIYRDLDRVRRIWVDCQTGRYEVGNQAGHPLGFYSTVYVGELALGRVLADPTGELTALQQTLKFPDPLRAALIDHARWGVPFALAGARKAVSRGDAFYVAGCLFRAVGLLVHALHADAGAWVLNEKDAVRAAGELPAAPRDFAVRAHALFGSGGVTPEQLGARLDDTQALADEVAARIGH